VPTRTGTPPGSKPPTGVRQAGFICRCGAPMVWVKGHAVCGRCENFLPACKCE